MTSFALNMYALLWIFIVLFTLCECQPRAPGSEKYAEESNQVHQTVFHKYNKKVRPYSNLIAPVMVKVEASLIHIRDLDLLKKEMESILDLQITWQDKRLAWYANQVRNISATLDDVWVPSLIYLNGALLPRPIFNPKLGISSEGLIIWHRRETITTICHTQPKDTKQICAIVLGFSSPVNEEMFDNNTSFRKQSDFSNHLWNIFKHELDLEDENKVAVFSLGLVKPGHDVSEEDLDAFSDRDNSSLSKEDSYSGGCRSAFSWFLCSIVYIILLSALFLCDGFGSLLYV